MLDLFRRELELCKVRKGETLAVLSQGDSLREYANVFLAAARELGAEAVDVRLPGTMARGSRTTGTTSSPRTPRR